MQDPLIKHTPAKLRGLDPMKLLGVLESRVEDDPQIPGWTILGIAGRGGFGAVWRARRDIDGVEAAIKIAPLDDCETVERIEDEVAVLSALSHPNIVSMIASGPLEEPVGGMFLAMEFVDGPALSEVIPADGLPPSQALDLFFQIMAGVECAHARGILHRDLKPANILLGTDGGVRVADFGLALPVHRRIHKLSLTRAGLVVGTAEYLPPEAYHEHYRPSPATDIFAMGVILHEMLTGSPPRGAWYPASRQKPVDVRIDGVIRRALDPDPAKRWPDVGAMRAELDAIRHSQPRFAGTPRISFPVRLADALWTMIGLSMALAGTASLLKLRGSRWSLPFELVGSHSETIGAFHALFILTLAGLGTGIWQVLRLWRFRGVPLREALPSPFGLRLGHTTVSAAIVAAFQGLCVLLPVMQMMTFYIDYCMTWIEAVDPPWLRGLAVVEWEHKEILSPWGLNGWMGKYWLLDTQGPPGHPLAVQFDRIGFNPLLFPLIMAAGGAAMVSALIAALAVACRSWWMRARPLPALTAALVGAILFLGFTQSMAEQRQRIAMERFPSGRSSQISDRMVAHVSRVAEEIVGSAMYPPVFNNPSSALVHYAEIVDYRDHGQVAREQIPELAAAVLVPAEKRRAEVINRLCDWDPASGRFSHQVTVLETLDGWPDSGSSAAAMVTLDLSGTITRDGRTAITTEKETRHPVYAADRRHATVADGKEWARSFQKAVLRQGTSGTGLPGLDHLFFDGLPNPWRTSPRAWIERKQPGGASLLHLLASGQIRLDPDRASVPAVLPGSRTRVHIPMRTGAGPYRALKADLIHHAGVWRCVDLAL